jgi:ribosomal protein S20
MKRKILGAVAVVGALGAGAMIGLWLGVPGLSAAKPPPPPPPGSAPVPYKVVGPFGLLRGPSLDTAAKALGMTTADLKTALGKGQSLAAVARSRNVDPQKVVDALAQDATSHIDAAVKAGKISQAQAARLKQNLAVRISNFVNRTLPGNGRGFRGRPRGGAGPLRRGITA